MTVLLRCALAVLAGGAVSLPPWWAAGRLVSGRENAFFRLLVTIGLALVGWLGAVNLMGRQLQGSRVAAGIWLALNTVAAAWLLWRRRDELSPRGLAASWRTCGCCRTPPVRAARRRGHNSRPRARHRPCARTTEPRTTLRPGGCG